MSSNLLPIGESTLPPKIAETLAQLLKGYPRAVLKPDVDRLLDACRSTCQVHYDHILTGASKESVDPDLLPKSLMDYNERETKAYLACQFPFAYGPIQRVMKEIAGRIPEFQLKSVLDFGTGPGTAILC